MSIPPSVNHIYRRARNGAVFRSRAYTSWIARNLFHTGRRISKVPGTVTVTVEVHGGKGWRKGRDLDNVLKPLMDYLQHIGAIADDCSDIVQRITVSYHNPEKPASKAFVTIAVESR